jgi:hypothetical protein
LQHYRGTKKPFFFHGVRSGVYNWELNWIIATCKQLVWSIRIGRNISSDLVFRV